MADRARVFLDGYAAGWIPDPELTVSQWADAHRQLSIKASAEPGQWRTERTPYLREIMDALSALSTVRRVVFQKGAQIGATETGLNWLGYIMHHCPGPTLMVQPTVDMAKRVSKQRLAPMIEATPALRGRVKEARSRDSGNTMFVKEFDGGLLILTGANSSNALRSMPIRFLFLDEVDSYPGDLDEQGDPVKQAERSTFTFARRKVFLCSTPTIKGISRIEKEYQASDQRRYFVPCPHCGHFDWLRWENIRWDEDRPETAALLCVECGSLIEERHKTEMLARGEWRATAEGDGKTRGYHLSGLYSPLGWKSWGECASEFLAAKDDPPALKTWINIVLGQTWEDRGLSVSPEGLLGRLESYAAEVPNGVGVLVASVDVQDNRLEAQVKGYGVGEESWLVATHQEHGDPAGTDVWLKMDAFLKQEWTHASGQKMRIECVAVDSGGHFTEQVYKFCKARQSRRVFAVRGGNERGRPLVGRPSANNRYRAQLFTLCVDTGKEIVYSRLKINAAGPGYCHLPEWTDPEYVAQLTAETAIRKYVKGLGAVREWVKTRERNEALDLEVYCLAALYILGPVLVRSLPERAARFAKPVGSAGAAAPSIAPPASSTNALPPQPSRRLPGGRGRRWVDSWK